MNLANKLTFLRIILAPVFFVFYFLPDYFPELFINGTSWTIPVLWFIYIISELTDYFDGLAARKLNQTSDFGKLFDPFADTLVQLTCFLCFVIDGMFPAILFLLIIYREFSILFLRNLMLKKGITLGARIGGKIKTVAYIMAVGIALIAVSLKRLCVCEPIQEFFTTAALVVFIISVIIAVFSFIDYLLVYLKTGKNNE